MKRTSGIARRASTMIIAGVSAIGFFVAGASIAYAGAPPYANTTRLSPRVITPADYSAFLSMTNEGLSTDPVLVPDRRSSGPRKVEVYRFNASFKLAGKPHIVEFRVDSRDYGAAEAADQARKYAFVVGQLPIVLYEHLNFVIIHKGNEKLSGMDTDKFPHTMLIHTGNAEQLAADGYLEETLVHEGTHAVLDGWYYPMDSWKQAREADGTFLTTYAQAYPDREDIATSFLAWVDVRFGRDRISAQDYNTIVNTIPHRLKFFDDRNLAVFPAR
ncbi:hypothetical protein [Burkholderia stagnalis]